MLEEFTSVYSYILMNVGQTHRIPAGLSTLMLVFLFIIYLSIRESWTLNQRDEKAIWVFERWTYQIFLRISYKEHKSNK